MPNRILRDGILTSERINNLSLEEELFYRRLISVVDDYGRYYTKPELLRSACFPLKVDKIKNSHIEKWLKKLAHHMLIKCYQVDNKGYLEINDFRQQIRAKQSKFPCIADAQQMVSNDHLDVVEDVVEDEDESMSGKPAVSKIDYKAKAKELLILLNEKSQKNYQPVEANLDLITARLKEYDEKTVRQVIVKKCRDFVGDEKMDMYARPATLFNKTKFAQYSGELVVRHEN